MAKILVIYSSLTRTLIFTFCLISLSLLTSCASLGPLHRAAESGNINKVRTLLDAGADVNHRANPGLMELEPDGITPLFLAAKYGHADAVRLLIKNGADVNAKSNSKANALGTAARWGHTDIARILLDAGAEVDVVDGWSGGTPLSYATEMGNSTLVRLLLKAGADPGLAWFDKSPLKIARAMGNTSIIRMLEEAEGRHNMKSTKSYSFVSETDTAVQEPDLSTQPIVSTGNLYLGSYHALVIGNNNYKYIAKLNTAINDAKSIGYVLQNEYGFKVKLIVDGTRNDMLSVLDGYRMKLTQNDNLLIYYAGHGYYDKEAERGYWLPIDARETTKVAWLSNVDITDTLKATKAKHVMVVADSCYSGTLTRSIHVKLRSPEYLSRISRKKARTVLTSGGLEPVSDSGGGSHSVFAKVFLDVLKENTGVMDGTLLFTKLRRPVMVNSDQTPQYSDIRKAGHDGGDFLFVRKKKK